MIYVFALLFLVAILAYFLPHRAVWILLGAVIIVAGLAGLAYWLDAREQASIRQISVTLGMGQEECADPTPLGYRIHNQSDRTVYRTQARYSVYQEGYSTPLSKSYRNELRADNILQPGEQTFGCIPLPTLSRKRVPIKQLRFELNDQQVWFDEPGY